jgi:hypothetical protein
MSLRFQLLQQLTKEDLARYTKTKNKFSSLLHNDLVSNIKGGA